VLYFPFHDLGEEVEPQNVKKLIVNSHIPSGIKRLIKSILAEGILVFMLLNCAISKWM